MAATVSNKGSWGSVHDVQEVFHETKACDWPLTWRRLLINTGTYSSMPAYSEAGIESDAMPFRSRVWAPLLIMIHGLLDLGGEDLNRAAEHFEMKCFKMSRRMSLRTSMAR